MSLFRPRARRSPPALIAQAQNDLGLRLLSRLARDRPESNVCLSPSGLALSLAAAYLGASRSTHDDLGTALGLSSSAASDAETHLQAWQRSLSPPGEDDPLTLAVSLWLPTDSTLDPAYLERLRSCLGAHAAVLSRHEGSAVNQINAWASRSTRGRIPHVLSSIDVSALLTLVTAVDFHARWQTSFDSKYTRQAPFRLGPGRVVHLPLMMQSGSYPHFRTDELEGVALAYAGERRRMVVLLPSENRSLDGLLDSLNSAAWRNLTRRFRREDGTIALPLFQLEGTLSLDRPLADLGLARMFDLGRAEFDGLGSGQGASAVGQLAQTVRLEADEEGTQASAVTLMVQVVAGSLPRQQFFEMRVDRPFLFAIEDQGSQTLLFAGAVRDPRHPSRRQDSTPPAFDPPPGTPPEIRRLASL